MKDELYAKQDEALSKIRAFAFDEQVVPVFQDMISRSVPGYETMLQSIGMFAMRYSQENTQLYDLGSSLGAVSFVLSKSSPASCKVIAIDNSQAMIDASHEKLTKQNMLDKINLVHDDIENVVIDNASVIVSNFTLQFIEKSHRPDLIQKIYRGLNPGGIFILSEKIRASDDDDNAFLIDHYHGYKKINGYSDEEIARKRKALENVLVPDSLSQWKARLEESGFTNIHLWFRCFNFISLVAIKGD